MTKDRQVPEARTAREARRIINHRFPDEHIVGVRRVDPMTPTRGFVVTTDPNRRADPAHEAANR